MTELQPGAVESRFADIIWQHAPVISSQQVKLGEAEMSWNRTTVHTVLRRPILKRIVPPYEPQSLSLRNQSADWLWQSL